MQKMNLKKILIITGLYISCLALQAQLPVFDKKKSYPEKRFNYIPEYQHYIPLETTPEVLVDKDGHLDYFSDKRIVVTNPRLGDVFVFDINGKVLSHFNRKGSDAYLSIGFVAYDEKKQEIYILDRNVRKIFVFTENGTFKRLLRFPSDHIWFTEIYNFDDNTLMAIHDPQGIHESNIIDSKVKKPYMFISKKDGSLISVLNISIEKILTDKFTVQTGPNEAWSFKLSSGGCCHNTKFGDEYILANHSMDTVFLLKSDKTLTPLFVQTPSVFSEHPEVIDIGMKTDNYIFFAVKEWDLLKSKEEGIKGRNYTPASRYFIYDLKNRQFFGKLTPAGPERVDVPKNIDACLINAENFLESVKREKKPTGNSKQVASRLNDEDNPVVYIRKIIL